LLAQVATGNISATQDMTWVKYGLSFTATTTSVTLLLISNAPGGYGNDLAIDDITFRVCAPGATPIGISGKQITDTLIMISLLLFKYCLCLSLILPPPHPHHPYFDSHEIISGI
jgi:hypothetical protein